MTATQTPVGEGVRYEIVRPHIALVTLDNPARRNAISPAMAEGLDAAVRASEADPEIRAVVLTGSGLQAFCAGADLKAVSEGGLDRLFTETGGFAGFVHAPRSKVWIAAVEGFALAGGFEIMLACDLAVASEASVFGLPEVTRGLVASAGGAYRTARALPRAVALELLATGGRLDATRAHALGLVNRLAPAGTVLEAALALAGEVCANAPVAVRESVAIARQAADLDEASLRRLSDEAQARIVETEDFQEGPRAFVEKRAPVWVGR